MFTAPPAAKMAGALRIRDRVIELLCSGPVNTRPRQLCYFSTRASALCSVLVFRLRGLGGVFSNTSGKRALLLTVLLSWSGAGGERWSGRAVVQLDVGQLRVGVGCTLPVNRRALKWAATRLWPVALRVHRPPERLRGPPRGSTLARPRRICHAST